MNKNPPKPPRTRGGTREGAGRKPDWLKLKCQKLIDRHKLIEYLARVAAGKETEQRISVVRDGKEAHTEVVDVKCSTHDRLHAMEMLLDRCFGKASQPMTHDVGGTLEELLSKSWSDNG